MTSAYRFGRCELRPDEGALLVDGRPATLGQRALDLLRALVERRDRVVTKAELFDLVWPGLVVEENNLQVQVSALRKVVGPQAIATLPGRGYRFMPALDGVDATPAVAPAHDPASGRHSNIPLDLPRLYGRDADTLALEGLLAEHRLVTVVGAGGIGKSRLAQAVAHDLAGRGSEAWMIELAGLADPALVASAVGQPLGIKPASLEDLTAALDGRTAVLVLDNCEHLLDAVAPLAQAILDTTARITILATSQEPLRLPAEQQYRLLPLAVPAAGEQDARSYGAVALLEARVRATDPRFTLGEDDVALAADICRRLDGLPLAIELAAARAANLGLRPVRDKLDERFKLLTGGARHTLRRHQTLRAALEWSHGLLDDAERTVFRRLGTFAGGFTVELAQAVASDEALDEWRVLDILTLLVDKSLVSADAGDAPRYRLLESARAFALEKLGEAGHADAMRRHAQAMREFIVAVDNRNMDGELRTDQYAALVLPELDNLRAAYRWARNEDEMATAIAIAAYSGSLIDYATECIDWLLSIPKEAIAGLPPPLEARYWRAIAAGNLVGRVSPAAQKEAAVRARDLYRELDQPRRLFAALMRLSLHLGLEGDTSSSQAVLDEARALVTPDWPPEFRIQVLRRNSTNLRLEGRVAEARAQIEEGMRASAAAGDWRLEVMARAALVDLMWESGPLDEALAAGRALSDALRARPAAPTDMDVHFSNVLGILSEAGDVEGAMAAAREALPAVVRTRATYLEPWAHFLWRLGRHEAAARVLGASDARAGLQRQANEMRLLERMRPALASSLPPDRFVALHAEGAALSLNALYAVLGEAIA